MFQRKNLDVSRYLILGPENTKGRPVPDIVRAAVAAGFTCVQLRAKKSTAREILALARAIYETIAAAGAEARVPLLINDRLDLALAAREQGVPVTGVHVGQDDVPPEICRKLLGENSIVGLSAPREQLLAYIRERDLSAVDYLGAGPVHPTASKPDAGLLTDGTRHLRTFAELKELAARSPIPVIAGGGVTARDLPALKNTGVIGFFVISAVASAMDPAAAARELVEIWQA